MHFSRIRLTGFKSFIDGTDVAIEPGLTAIVGPNGCGKSNVVEALRWVMGESSARQLRGREMDDVIFGGSASRPSRNHAEVSVLLDNAARTAPAAFNEFTEIEVSRRIERGEGSVYRINGKEVRARDVQLLFADETTGSRSTALVSQGEVGALISAKPAERRALLDEAAGITGLHGRRHEAELRLRAAETNLERLDDVMGALEAQLQGLKRQARQATRYRRLSERIRQTEALLLYRRWQAAEEAVSAARQALDGAERTVVEHEHAAAAAAAEQADAAAVMPPLREAEAAAGAELHRLEVAQVSLEAEERRLTEARNALETRLGQIDADVERERTLASDAGAAIARLEEEHATLGAAQEGEDEAERAADAARAEAAEAVAALEHEVETLTKQLAGEEARRAALDNRIDELGARLERLRGEAAAVANETSALARRADAGAALERAEAAVATAREAVESKRNAADAAETRRHDLQAAEAAAREALQQAETACAALRAEAAALGESEQGEWPALIDAVTVEEGLETALGAALGDDLTASADAGAPIYWCQLPDAGAAPPLPTGATPLSEFVTAPTALARRLSQVGVVAASDGPRLLPDLAQGQRLVSLEGALWRWDGFTVAPEAETPAATRLRQKNRRVALRRELEEGEVRRTSAAQELEGAGAALRQAAADESEARAALRRAEEALEAEREAHARAVAAAAADASRLANLRESAERLGHDIEEVEEHRGLAREAREALASDADGRDALDAPRAALGERRAGLAEREHAYQLLRREAAARRERLAAIAAELETWRSRADGAGQRLAQLAERRGAAEAEIAALADRPAQIAAEREQLLERLEIAQGERRRAADAVAEAEDRLAAFDRKLKEAEATVARVREDRVRCEGIVQQTGTTRDEVARTIGERLECAPAELADLAGIGDGDEVPAVEDIETRLARFQRERDNMGPVNLRAEAEAAEVEEQLSALRDERTDLEAAIARLRQSIGRLSREGRERLETAFETINGHFGALFTRLFGGGRAHLSLVESDDPLEAGLEIMASPPGKRLQMLSLLSGGEQALTALALLFAVFLTNPTPICVLDEV
ncbi:MAG: chromosome segregation protein SMC, partial [Alphaproteobacteria bacterium]